MDFTVFIPLIKEGFLIYLKQNTKKKIQEDFFREIYSEIDRKKNISEENAVDQNTIKMIDDFEKEIQEKYLVDIDNATDENSVLAVYGTFVKDKDLKIREIKNIYKKVYGKFIP